MRALSYPWRAEGLSKRLISGTVSTLKDDAPKPKDLLDGDELIGSRKLGLAESAVTMTRVEDVFAR